MAEVSGAVLRAVQRVLQRVASVLHTVEVPGAALRAAQRVL